MAHSIPESNALILRTPHGNVLHTGDWKLDPTPVVGQPTDEAKLRRLGEEGVLAVDTETTSLDPMQATLCGFSLAVTPNEACYVPLAHRKNGAGEGLFDGGLEDEQIPEQDAIDAIKPVLEDPGILKIGQNLKFDWQVFSQRGVTIAPLDDTMLQSYVLDAGRSDHGMDPLAMRYLDHKTIEFNEVFPPPTLGDYLGFSYFGII